MKEKIKNLLKNGKAIIVFLILLELFLMIFVNTNIEDDKFFIELGQSNPNTFEIVKNRYDTWSSRVIIEFVLIKLLTKSKIVWAVLQSLMMGLLAYSISKLFIKEEFNEKLQSKLNNIIVVLILTYPLNMLTLIGWGASTINYIWPLATCLYAIIPIKKYYSNEKIKWYEYPFFVLALLFSANMEQTCAVLLGVYLFFTIIFFVKRKKIKIFMLVQLVFLIISTIFILKCPGNALRLNAETAGHFKDFKTLSLIEKITLGFTSSIGDILKWNMNLSSIILCFSIVIYIFSMYKEKLYRIIAIIPLVFFTSLGILSDILKNTFPKLGNLSIIFQTPEVVLTTANINKIGSFIPLIISIVIFSLIALSILIIFKKIKGNIPLLVFLVGLCSRIIASFSSTVFISAPRTILFFDFAMLIVSFLIIQDLIINNKEKQVNILTTIIECIAGLQVLNLLLFIFC